MFFCGSFTLFCDYSGQSAGVPENAMRFWGAFEDACPYKRRLTLACILLRLDDMPQQVADSIHAFGVIWHVGLEI